MEKKIYIAPLSEVMHLEASVVMKEFGPASLPEHMGNAAPKHRTDVF